MVLNPQVRICKVSLFELQFSSIHPRKLELPELIFIPKYLFPAPLNCPALLRVPNTPPASKLPTTGSLKFNVSGYPKFELSRIFEELAAFALAAYTPGYKVIISKV